MKNKIIRIPSSLNFQFNQINHRCRTYSYYSYDITKYIPSFVFLYHFFIYYIIYINIYSIQGLGQIFLWLCNWFHIYDRNESFMNCKHFSFNLYSIMILYYVVYNPTVHVQWLHTHFTLHCKFARSINFQFWHCWIIYVIYTHCTKKKLLLFANLLHEQRGAT